MKKDTVFSEKQIVEGFRFDERVAVVFDDMVDRSVPFYQEIQRMLVEQASVFAVQGTQAYDFGSATGTTLLALDATLPPSVALVGMDNSIAMLQECKVKLADTARAVSLMHANLDEHVVVENASIAMLILTLQFIRPCQRLPLLSSIYQGLIPGGALFLVEKVMAEESELERNYIQHYYAMKRRRGYSETEINQKREALENVLIPYTVNENLQMLHQVGFTKTDIFFKWYNFCGIVAVK